MHPDHEPPGATPAHRARRVGAAPFLGVERRGAVAGGVPLPRTGRPGATVAGPPRCPGGRRARVCRPRRHTARDRAGRCTLAGHHRRPARATSRGWCRLGPGPHATGRCPRPPGEPRGDRRGGGGGARPLGPDRADLAGLTRGMDLGRPGRGRRRPRAGDVIGRGPRGPRRRRTRRPRRPGPDPAAPTDPRVRRAGVGRAAPDIDKVVVARVRRMVCDLTPVLLESSDDDVLSRLSRDADPIAGALPRGASTAAAATTSAASSSACTATGSCLGASRRGAGRSRP